MINRKDSKLAPNHECFLLKMTTSRYHRLGTIKSRNESEVTPRRATMGGKAEGITALLPETPVY